MSEARAGGEQITIDFQGLPKSYFAQVWGKLQEGEKLDDAEQLLARSMADHPHWFPYFQTIGLFEQKDERYPGDVNPFLHVNLHMVIAFQLNQRRPKIITRYYQERIKKGESPHEIIHQLIEVFQRQLVWTITQGDRDGEGAGKVDLAAYGKTLKTLMRLSRRRLWQRLGAAEPPPLHPEADLATEL